MERTLANGHFIAGWGGYPLIGTPEQIVDGLIRMSKMGLDGTLLNWPRYVEDQHWFKDRAQSVGGAGGLAVKCHHPRKRMIQYSLPLEECCAASTAFIGCPPSRA